MAMGWFNITFWKIKYMGDGLEKPPQFLELSFFMM
jgi:hypothetical protein